MSYPTNRNLFQNVSTSLVLVVDDDRGMRLLLRNMMEQEGYQVIEAENGKQALEACQRFHPEVVLLDHLMPIMDGVTCCQRIHSLYGDRIAIVMITSLDDSNSVNRAFAAGAVDYVIKPIHRLVLQQKVLRIMRQASLVRQLQQTNAELEQHTQFYSVVSKERTAQFQRALALEMMLKRIADRVRDSLDENQILQTAVSELAIALHAVRCNASLYEYEQRLSRVCYEYKKSSISYQNRLIQMEAFSEVYQPLVQGDPVKFCPLRSPSFEHKASMFVFPIKYEKQSVGDLWVVCDAHRTLDDLEIRLMKQIANQCAIAIRQARLYQAAQTQVKELERLNQVKDDFVSMVSHELRSPLTNIQMAARMLEQLATQSEDQYGDAMIQNPNYVKSRSYLQIVQSECNREINLINDLLDLQCLEAGNQSIDLTLIDLEQWIPCLIQPFLERTQQRQQYLQLDLAPALPVIESNPHRLSRILTELLHNACKYTPPGETITLSISAHPTAKIVQFIVINTGVEIPIDEHKRIFDKFYRIPSGDRWKQGGTGLGLALVKCVTESLGGSIQLQSSNLQTCFTLQIPLARGT